VVVNNAGYRLFGVAEELTGQHQPDRPVRVVRAALPHLRAQGGGQIVGL